MGRTCGGKEEARRRGKDQVRRQYVAYQVESRVIPYGYGMHFRDEISIAYRDQDF